MNEQDLNATASEEHIKSAEENTVEPVATDETGHEVEQKEEPSDVEKQIFALQKRIDKLSSDKKKDRQRIAEYERQISEIQSSSSSNDTTDNQIDLATAIELGRISVKTDDIYNQGVKLFGKDFDDCIDTLNNEIPLYKKDRTFSPFMEAIVSSDQPAKIMKYLGDNPDELESLSKLRPEKMIRELTLIEARLNAKPTHKQSAAPKPLEPTRSKSVSAAVDPSDTERWIRERNAELLKRR